MFCSKVADVLLQRHDIGQDLKVNFEKGRER